MPILNFTAKDLLASRVMPAGWYGATFKELKDPQKSGSGKSFNFFSTFAIIEDPTFAEKELKVTFNTGMDQPSVMGTMWLMPHTQIPHVAAAILNIPIETVPKQFDSDQIVGGRLDIKVERIIHDGVVLNTISSFLPFGNGRDGGREDIPF